MASEEGLGGWEGIPQMEKGKGLAYVSRDRAKGPGCLKEAAAPIVTGTTTGRGSHLCLERKLAMPQLPFL